jgi:HSP20 family molecular chaperone IbpA
MSLFPAFPSGFASGEFDSLFRLLDDYASHSSRRRGDGGLGNSMVSSMRSFTPRFDVKETKDAYELHGELPGASQDNVQIEFTDGNTITIKGRVERRHEHGGPVNEEQQGHDYHKPTVEDESSGGQASSGEQQQQKSSTEVTTTSDQKELSTNKDGSRWWVYERSIGEFNRSFSFPTRIDQDAVKARLKDGILTVLVPKAQAPQPKRINIE